MIHDVIESGSQYDAGTVHVLGCIMQCEQQCNASDTVIENESMFEFLNAIMHNVKDLTSYCKQGLINRTSNNCTKFDHFIWVH